MAFLLRALGCLLNDDADARDFSLNKFRSANLRYRPFGRHKPVLCFL